jgi:hypothetical protein
MPVMPMPYTASPSPGWAHAAARSRQAEDGADMDIPAPPPASGASSWSLDVPVAVQIGPVAPQGSNGPCNQHEAKTNIDWVFRDSGARQTYANGRGTGLSPFDAVLGAQGHNPHAQQTILNCRGWAQGYLAKMDGGTTASNGGSQPSRACVSDPTVTDNYQQLSDFFGHPPNLWTAQVGVTANCRTVVIVEFCTMASDGKFQTFEYRYGPGVTVINPFSVGVMNSDSFPARPPLRANRVICPSTVPCSPSCPP